jgi:hypothetical protein
MSPAMSPASLARLRPVTHLAAALRNPDDTDTGLFTLGDFWLALSFAFRATGSAIEDLPGWCEALLARCPWVRHCQGDFWQLLPGEWPPDEED